MNAYPKAAQYPDLDTIYAECSGPGGLQLTEFLADKMGLHLDVPIPVDLLPENTRGGGVGPEGWAECFTTLAESEAGCQSVGFDIVEAAIAPDAWRWWEEYATCDPSCRTDPDAEARIIRQDGGRWLTYGYVIARKSEGQSYTT